MSVLGWWWWGGCVVCWRTNIGVEEGGCFGMKLVRGCCSVWLRGRYTGLEYRINKEKRCTIISDRRGVGTRALCAYGNINANS